jgi:hypothetical protein
VTLALGVNPSEQEKSKREEIGGDLDSGLAHAVDERKGEWLEELARRCVRAISATVHDMGYDQWGPAASRSSAACSAHEEREKGAGG